MELKTGMYVRTPKGISKIEEISINKEETLFICDIGLTIGFNTKDFTKEEMAKQYKHSYNKIDLIEVGDYVNGSKVIDFMYSKEKKRSVIVDSEIWGFDAEEIKSIVTKEEFSSMEYKVNE